jgi:hypothetical protein
MNINTIRIVFGIFVFLFPLHLLGQENKILSKKVNSNFTWKNSSKSQRDSFYFSLIDLRKTNCSTHYRISSNKQKVDIFSIDNVNFQGFVLNYIVEKKETDLGEYQSTKYYFQLIPLDTLISKRIAHKIAVSNLCQIPNDKLIKGWNLDYLHCNNLEFEFWQNHKYISTEYNCLYAQNDTISYKLIIEENINFIENEIKLKQLYDSFKLDLPKGKRYSSDDYRILYIPTNKQNRKYARDKPNRDYMDQVNDTLNKYLGDTLTKIFLTKGEFGCSYVYFQLNFSKNNKIKNVETQFIKKSKETEEEKKCRNEILLALRKIQFDFIKPKSDYWKEFYYSNGKVKIK